VARSDSGKAGKPKGPDGNPGEFKTTGKQEYVSIGKIIKSHGILGFTKVLPLTDFPERFEKLKEVFLFHDNQLKMRANIEQIRLNNTNLLIKFAEFNTPEAVNLYREHLIKIPYEEILELPENSFYIDDLKGLEAYSEAGAYLGKVIEVYTAASDIIEVLTPLKKEIMVPFVKEIISEVDISNRKVIIRLIPGLFDDDSE
jgi:16S rRNA processing protein RimM